MIQRIQTIYLLLAAVICGLMYVFSLALVVTRGASYAINVGGVEYYGGGVETELMSFWALGLTIFIAGLTSVGTIFLYKNRKLQLTFCKLNLLMYLAVIFTGFYSGDQAVEFVNNMGLEATLEHKMGAILPIFSAILILLATRAIKKDEELVRSADRIR